MKQLYFFLFFIIGTFASSLKYHGNRTYWTTVDDQGKTFVALHILAEPVNIIFPKDKIFADIASEMKLYSPNGNEKCQDTVHTLQFKLAFDGDEKYIRGEIKVVVDIGDQIFKVFLYEKCRSAEYTQFYGSGILDSNEADLEGDSRRCFKTDNPFHAYEKDDTKYVMELQSTPNNFGCQVFMILPEYMQLEDFPLPTFNTTELNATFAGYDEKFWWKSKNDSMLPTAVSFDSRNVRINILKSTKDEPYFFRIGTEQPIPAFNLTFGENCNGAKFEMFFNLKPECLVLLEKKDEGFMVSTKTSPYNHFKGSLPSMIMGDEHVFIKVDSPLSITALKVCNFSNPPDVPPDQFVLQVALLEGNNACEKAEVVLLNSDAKNGTEVLIDRSQIMVDTNGTLNENSTVLITTSETAASGRIEWYWYLIIGILIVGILAGMIILVFCIRRRRQRAKKSKILVESVEDEEVGRRTITTKTAVSPEKASKEMKPPKESDGGTKDEKKKEKQAKKEATKGNDKPPTCQKGQPAKNQPVQQPKPLPPPPLQPSEEKVVQPPTAPKPPLPLPVVAPPKPLRNLKFRSMYGEDKRTKLDEPFDYHADENSEFKPTKEAAEFHRPDLRVHDNFWDCLAGILKTTMFCQVFADDFFNGNSNVYFMFRDLVADSEKYAPLRILSNRFLEQYEDQPRKSVPPFLEKGGKKRIQTNWCYCLRVFVLSYDPLTVEIHCRGPWPHFMFEIFKCDKCGNLLEQLLKNEWKNSPVACDESWDQFVCRVKRTPVNFHQFLCYYGGPGSSEPENPNDVHNVFVFRGEWNSDNLRACTRGCSIPDDKSHFNECELETSLQKSPSLSK